MHKIIKIQNLIYEVRGLKVMLDRDLAALYNVPVKSLNQAVKRNLNRFPSDFMFKLTDDEWSNLRSQIVTANLSKVRYNPYAFTEQGVAMLSGVLQSDLAIAVNIQIMRTFVQIKQFALENRDLSKRVSELEHYFIEHCNDYKEDMKEIQRAIDLLMNRTKPTRIGFISSED